MANSSREIRRRIKSVKNIGQITKAMELVSAAKMRKSQTTALASRPYANLTKELLSGLLFKIHPDKHPLFKKAVDNNGKNTSHKNLAILITSDRGLAGAFNTNLVNKAIEYISLDKSEEYDFIAIGKKGADALKRFNQNIIAFFKTFDKQVTMNDIRPISTIAMDEFLSGVYKKVVVVYPDFISTLVQKPNIYQVLPFQYDTPKAFDEDFLFEPSPEAVLANLVENSIEFTIYQCVVEAAASEHSARMVAMRNANDAASDLMDELTLTYNQARQAGITKELSEISAAKLAMEQ